MQLRTTRGYRDIHCGSCRLHERCSHNQCQCSVIWHQCSTHRIDPPVHRTTKKASEHIKKDLKNQRKKLASTRRAPESHQAAPKRRKVAKKDKQPKLHIVQNAAAVLYPPHPAILHNIRERERNRKRASSSTASPEEAFSDKRAHTSKLDASTGRPEPNGTERLFRGCTNHVADTNTCTAGQAGYCDGTDTSTGIHHLPRVPSSNAIDAEEDQHSPQVHEFLGNQAATAVGQGGGMETQARLPAKPADLVRDTKSTRDLDDSQAQQAKKAKTQANIVCIKDPCMPLRPPKRQKITSSLCEHASEAASISRLLGARK